MKGALGSKGSSFPSFDTPPLFHPTSSYSCFLSISHLEGSQKKKSGFPFAWVNNSLIQVCLSLSGTYVGPVGHSKCLILLIVFAVPTPELERYGKGKEESEGIKQGFSYEHYLGSGIQHLIKHQSFPLCLESQTFFAETQNQQPFCTESFSTGQKEEPNTRVFRDVNSDPTT